MKALDLLEESLIRIKKLFGRNHQECIKTEESIACILIRIGAYKEAEKMYRSILTNHSHYFAKKPMRLVRVNNHFARLLCEVRQFEDALNMVNENLYNVQKLAGKTHPQFCET